MAAPKRSNRLCDVRRQALSSVAITAIAFVLSSCSVTESEDDPLVESIWFVDQPSPLPQSASSELADADGSPMAAAVRIAGAPLELVKPAGSDWVTEYSEMAVADHHSTASQEELSDAPGNSSQTPALSEQPSAEPPHSVNPARPAWWVAASEEPMTTELADGTQQSPLSLVRPDRTVEATADSALAEPRVGQPLQLIVTDRPDWVMDIHSEPVVAEPAVGQPLQLVAADRPDWVMDLHSDPVVAQPAAGQPLQLAAADRPDWSVGWHGDHSIAERVAGEPLQLIDSDGPDWLDGWYNDAIVAERSTEQAVPLVLSDGSYHWPDPVGARELAAGSCLPDGGTGTVDQDCDAWDDQIALADAVVDDAALSDMRGGFVTVGGFQIDFGFYIETVVDGVTELTSALTLDDMLAGQTAGSSVFQSATLNGAGDTSTVIQHNLSADQVTATIANTQSNVNISTIATLAIDVIDLRAAQTGIPGGDLGRMPLELQQSIIRGISR